MNSKNNRSLTVDPSGETELRQEGGKVAAGKRLFWSVDLEYTTSKAGNEMVVSTYVCVGDDLTGGAEIGMEVKDYTVLNNRNVYKLNKVAFCMDVKGQFDVYDSNGEYNSQLMEDTYLKRPVFLDIKTRTSTYNGEERVYPYVDGMIRFDGEETEEMNQIMVRAERRMDALSKWKEKNSYTKSAPVRNSGSNNQTSHNSGTEEEIPF